MNNYKYFRDVLKNGYFTETPCQFCGSSEHCLEGSFFDRDDNLVSICLNCFDKRNDYMTYIGEWEREDFIKNSTNGDGLSLLKELLIDELKNNVESYEALWADLGYETAAFVFKCSKCGNKVVVCQDY